MDFFRSVKFKTNIDFFYDCAEYISEDSTFNIDDSVYMCWTDDNKKFIPIHNFIDKLKNKLNCEISRSCYTVQRSKKSNIKKPNKGQEAANAIISILKNGPEKI